MAETTTSPHRFSRRDYAFGFLAVVGSLSLYTVTLAPTVTWGDPAKLTVFAYDLYLRVWAANHPLHTLVGWLWGLLPFPDYAYGQNLLSALFASLTVGITYLIVLKMTSSRVAALLGSFSLAISHTFWWLAVVAESYSLFLFLLSVCMFSVLMWAERRQSGWLYLFAFVFALGITNHTLVLLFAPAFLCYLLWHDPRSFFQVRVLAGMTISFLAGLALLLAIFAYSVQWYSPAELLYQMTTGSVEPFWQGTSKAIKELSLYALYLGYQFPSAALLLGLAGIPMAIRRNRGSGLLLIMLFVLDVMFSAGYMYQRQFETLTPSYLTFAIAVGVGCDHFLRKVRRVRGFASTPTARAAVAAALILPLPFVTYYATPAVLRAASWDPLQVRNLAYRDNAYYFFSPDKRGYYGASLYGREVLEKLPLDAVLLADFTPLTVLQYLQTVEKVRQDVLIVNVEAPGSGRVATETVQKYTGTRPIFFTDYRVYPGFFAAAELGASYHFVPLGNVFMLERKE